jgi:hypothetical protein
MFCQVTRSPCSSPLPHALMPPSPLPQT